MQFKDLGVQVLSHLNNGKKASISDLCKRYELEEMSVYEAVIGLTGLGLVEQTKGTPCTYHITKLGKGFLEVHESSETDKATSA